MNFQHEAPIAREATQHHGVHDEVLDLRFLFGKIGRNWWVILLFGLLGLVYGIYQATQFVPKRVASMVIMPQSGGMAGLNLGGGQGGGVTGVAATLKLAMGGGGGGGNETFERLRLAMSSITLARELDEKYGLLRQVYDHRWDAGRQGWRPVTDADLGLQERLLRHLNVTNDYTPSIEKLARHVGGKVQFEQIKKSEFWRVKVEDIDGDAALELLNNAYWTADELLREQDREQVRARQAYLRSRVDDAQLTEIRRALIGAMMSEERTAMLLEGGLPYAAKVIERPFLSENPTQPNLMLLIGIPVAAGLLLGFALVTLIAVFRSE